MPWSVDRCVFSLGQYGQKWINSNQGFTFDSLNEWWENWDRRAKGRRNYLWCLLFSRRISIHQPPTHCEVDDPWNALKTQERIQFKTQPSSRIPVSVHCHQIPFVTHYNNVLQVHTIYNQSSDYSHKHYTGKILMAGCVYLPMWYIH